VGLCSATVAILLSSCQLALDVDGAQCEADSDCVGLFGRQYVCTARQVCLEREVDGPADSGGPDAPPANGNLPPEWACIDQPRRMVNPVSGRAISIRLAVTDFVDLMSPPGLAGKACNATDVPCDRPVLQDNLPDSAGY
jgi:hypothetical protein